MDLSIAWLTGAAGTVLGLATGRRIGLPLAQVFLFWPYWLNRTLGHPDLAHSALLVLYWALGATLVLVPATRLFPARLEALVLRGTAYRDEMFDWIRTGTGPEEHPARMLLFHARQALVYAALALLTINALSLLLGALLLNYMNFYVGSLFVHARRPWLVALLGWNLWSILRVLAFCTLGAALGLLSIHLIKETPLPEDWRPLTLLATLGLALDPLLKLAASRPAARTLARATKLPPPVPKPHPTRSRFAPTLQDPHRPS